MSSILPFERSPVRFGQRAVRFRPGDYRTFVGMYDVGFLEWTAEFGSDGIAIAEILSALATAFRDGNDAMREALLGSVLGIASQFGRFPIDVRQKPPGTGDVELRIAPEVQQ